MPHKHDKYELEPSKGPFRIKQLNQLREVEKELKVIESETQRKSSHIGKKA